MELVVIVQCCVRFMTQNGEECFFYTMCILYEWYGTGLHCRSSQFCQFGAYRDSSKFSLTGQLLNLFGHAFCAFNAYCLLLEHTICHNFCVLVQPNPFIMHSCNQ